MAVVLFSVYKCSKLGNFLAIAAMIDVRKSLCNWKCLVSSITTDVTPCHLFHQNPFDGLSVISLTLGGDFNNSWQSRHLWRFVFAAVQMMAPVLCWARISQVVCGPDSLVRFPEWLSRLSNYLGGQLKHSREFISCLTLIVPRSVCLVRSMFIFSETWSKRVQVPVVVMCSGLLKCPCYYGNVLRASVRPFTQQDLRGPPRFLWCSV